MRSILALVLMIICVGVYSVGDDVDGNGNEKKEDESKPLIRLKDEKFDNPVTEFKIIPENDYNVFQVIVKGDLFQQYQSGVNDFTVDKEKSKNDKNGMMHIGFIIFIPILDVETGQIMTMIGEVNYQINDEMYDLLRSKGFRHVRLEIEYNKPSPKPDAATKTAATHQKSLRLFFL